MIPRSTATLLTHVSRYAYFKKLTYFSTECIYSPDGQYLKERSRFAAERILQLIEGMQEYFSRTSKRSVRLLSSISFTRARRSS